MAIFGGKIVRVNSDDVYSGNTGREYEHCLIEIDFSNPNDTEAERAAAVAAGKSSGCVIDIWGRDVGLDKARSAVPGMYFLGNANPTREMTENGVRITWNWVAFDIFSNITDAQVFCGPEFDDVVDDDLDEDLD